MTGGLLPWIKAADIEPSVKGSDYCPVWVDMREEVEVGGRVERLSDVMFCGGAEGGGAGREPPRLAAELGRSIRGDRRCFLRPLEGR